MEPGFDCVSGSGYVKRGSFTSYAGNAVGSAANDCSEPILLKQAVRDPQRFSAGHIASLDETYKDALGRDATD